MKRHSKRHPQQHRITATSLAAQRARIGDYLLKHGRASTIELRDNANAMHPAARVMEMRRAGWRIITQWRKAFDAQGRPHRCGLYVLLQAGGR